jgi:cyclohexa-1,5-dienecarbonyl-CoA hydratase
MGETVSERVDTELVQDGTLLRVRFQAPKGNVLTSALLSRIESALSDHADDQSLKLVALEGEGESFSYGASVEEHQKDRVEHMLSTFHALVRRLVTYPLPVAALVRGRCLGGAFELTLACRFVLARHDAVFACPEVKLGVFPPVLAALGWERLGGPLTERLALTGAEMGAREACNVGWVTEVAEDPVAAVFQLHERCFRSHSAFAIRQTLEALRRGSGAVERVGSLLTAIEKQYLHRVVRSHDGNEGISAFLEKRPPNWTHA